MSTPMLVVIDETEPRIAEYRAMNVQILVRPGESIGAAQKVEFAFQAYPDLAWYGFVPDDCEPMTKGWDVELAAACQPDCVAYASEGLHKIKRSMPIIGGDLLRAVGFVVPPGLEHYGGDRFWKSLASATNRTRLLQNHIIRLTDHIIEHDNPPAWDEPKSRQKARQRKDKDTWQALRDDGFMERMIERIGVKADA